MLVKKSRIALRPRISTLSPPAGLSGVRSVASLAHGTRDMSFAAMPSKYAFTLCFRLLSFIAASPLFGHLQRSEEHTSELQSRLHLVCRLLLEKKNNTNNQYSYTKYMSVTFYSFITITHSTDD